MMLKSVQEAVNAAMIEIKPQIPAAVLLLEGILTDIAVAAANTEEAANAFNDAESKGRH